MKSPFKRLGHMVAAAGAGGALLLAMATAASATISPAPKPAANSGATLRAEIAAQLRYNPHGVVINARQVSYDNGRVIVTVASPGSSQSPNVGDGFCRGGNVCIWEFNNRGGSSASISGPLDSNIPIRAYIPQVESLDNQRSYGSLLSNGSVAICYPSGAYAPDISSPYKNYPWLYLEHAKNCN